MVRFLNAWQNPTFHISTNRADLHSHRMIVTAFASSKMDQFAN